MLGLVVVRVEGGVEESAALFNILNAIDVFPLLVGPTSRILGFVVDLLRNQRTETVN